MRRITCQYLVDFLPHNGFKIERELLIIYFSIQVLLTTSITTIRWNVRTLKDTPALLSCARAWYERVLVIHRDPRESTFNDLSMMMLSVWVFG
jgi:hypothetical protein